MDGGGAHAEGLSTTAFCADGLLYVVGKTARSATTTPLTPEALQPMTYPHGQLFQLPACCRLYAIGSLAGKETMVMQCYHPDTDLWSLVDCGQLPPWSFAPKTVTLNGLMYFHQVSPQGPRPLGALY